MISMALDMIPTGFLRILVGTAELENRVRTKGTARKPPASNSLLCLSVQDLRPILLLDPVLHSRKRQVQSKLECVTQVSKPSQKFLSKQKELKPL